MRGAIHQRRPSGGHPMLALDPRAVGAVWAAVEPLLPEHVATHPWRCRPSGIGLILMLGAVSGAHFNPVVTLVDRAFGTLTAATPPCTSPPSWWAAASGRWWPRSCSSYPPSASPPPPGHRGLVAVRGGGHHRVAPRHHGS